MSSYSDGTGSLTCTWWPAAVSSRAPSGVSATRYSLSLTSFGTPTITQPSFPPAALSVLDRSVTGCDLRGPVQTADSGFTASKRAVAGDPVRNATTLFDAVRRTRA